MSTKINSRSPFYITATEPTVSEGAFSCTTAGLANFSVESDGTIIEPTILKGIIIDRDVTSFAALSASDSSVSRTVNYTIQIPDGFSNTTDGTLSCPQTFTQLPPTTCVQSSNNNMAVFTGTISDITNVTTGSTVSLGSFFSNGTSATITSYEIVRYGDSAITATLSGTVPNQTLTFSTTSTGVSADFIVRARNSVDACITSSNKFTVSGASAGAADCNTISLSGGSIASTGLISVPSYNVGNLTRINIKSIAGVSNTTEVTTSSQQTSNLANSTGSSRTIVLTFRFSIPQGYSNAGGNLDCDATFTQPATSTPALVCTDNFLSYSGFRITTTGDIIAGEVDVNGTNASVLQVSTDQSDGLGGFKSSFDTVTSATARTIKVTFLVPSGFSNTGAALTCDVSGLTQPPSSNPCDITNPEFFISDSSFSSKTGFCDNNRKYTVNNSVIINSSGTLVSNIVGGNIVCDRGTPMNGGNEYFAISVNPSASGAGNIGSSFKVIRIDEFGVVTESPVEVNCGSDTGFDNIL